MSGIKFYILDTETTGLKSNYNEVNEIGIIRFDDKMQIFRNIKCLYPERASYDALKITNKTLSDLNKGFDKEQVVNECEKFFAEDGLNPAHRCIVAHNASFDKKFCQALWQDCGKEFPADLWLDTIQLVKHFATKNNLVDKGFRKYALHTSCDLLGVKKISEAHNAKVDSRNTYFLFKKLLDENVNYLPFIKNNKHILQSDGRLDVNDLDIDG